MTDRPVAAVTAVTRFGPREGRGHQPKLERIFAELKAEGLPDDLRPVERQKRFGIKARELGYTDKEIPSRTAIGRWWSKYKANKMGNTDNETNETLC